MNLAGVEWQTTKPSNIQRWSKYRMNENDAWVGGTYAFTNCTLQFTLQHHTRRPNTFLFRFRIFRYMILRSCSEHWERMTNITVHVRRVLVCVCVLFFIHSLCIPSKYLISESCLLSTLFMSRCGSLATYKSLKWQKKNKRKCVLRMITHKFQHLGITLWYNAMG